MIGLLTMREAAQATGLSYEHFRKIWPALCAETGFPAPIRGRVWDTEAVAAWRKARSERALNVVALAQPVATPPAAAARRARAQLHLLRAG